MDYYANNDWRNHLSHYGIHGQKWHRRRFQNLDDSLTPEGRKRYPPLPDYVRYARIAEENRKRNPYKKLLKDFEQKEIDDFQTKEIKKLFKKDGFEFTGDMGELREYLKTHSAATYKEILKEFEPEKDEKDKQKPEDEDIEKVEDPIEIESIEENKKQLKHQLIENSLDLYHHGIEGQKWGVRNGPPYPLDESQMGADEKLANQDTYGLIDDALKRINASKEAKENMKRYLTERDANGTIDKRSGLYLKTKQMSIEQDMELVNPLYNKILFRGGAINNCRYCSVTYDFRRRGYDVTADFAHIGFDTVNGLGYKGLNYNVFKAIYPKAKSVMVWNQDPAGKNKYMYRPPADKSEAGELFRQLSKCVTAQGEGARGEFNVGWKGLYYGHSMAYEIRGGKPVFLDTQSNEKLKKQDLVDLLMDTKGYVLITRLDNVKIRPKYAKGVVR